MWTWTENNQGHKKMYINTFNLHQMFLKHLAHIFEFLEDGSKCMCQETGQVKSGGCSTEHHDPTAHHSPTSPAANLEASTPLRRRSSNEKIDPMTVTGWRFQGRRVMGIPLKQYGLPPGRGNSESSKCYAQKSVFKFRFTNFQMTGIFCSSNMWPQLAVAHFLVKPIARTLEPCRILRHCNSVW